MMFVTPNKSLGRDFDIHFKHVKRHIFGNEMKDGWDFVFAIQIQYVWPNLRVQSVLDGHKETASQPYSILIS